MAFKVIRTDDKDLTRVQQNVADEFKSLEVPATVPVQVVQATAGSAVTTYQVREQDVYLIVNARGGPIRVVLPVPNRATQAVSILNAFISNKVTVSQADGAAFAGGDTSISLQGGVTAQMVTDGKAWYRFGAPA